MSYGRKYGFLWGFSFGMSVMLAIAVSPLFAAVAAVSLAGVYFFRDNDDESRSGEREMIKRFWCYLRGHPYPWIPAYTTEEWPYNSIPPNKCSNCGCTSR